MDRVLQFLSGYATNLTYERLPKEAVHHVKRRTIDALGCAVAAYIEGPVKAARVHALEVTAKPGATVLGTRHRTAPELAAFANGVMVRYLDFNDAGLAKDPGHPSDNIPAVLAAAEYVGAEARTAITGIVLSYEIMGRLGETGQLRKRGWDAVVFEGIAAAAGASKAMGLSTDQIANALAIMATSNGGLRQTRVGTLSTWKGCAAANAGHNGVFAAILARQGLTGPEQAFEGRCGFFNQITGPMELPVFGGDGHPFKVEDAKYKYFPAEYLAQCAVHPALEIRQALQNRTDEIEKVIVDTCDLAVDVAADSPDKWNPVTRETADHSIPYVLAVAFTKGTIWLDDFSEERIRDPALHDLMQKIEVRRNEEFNKTFPATQSFRIEVLTRSGDRHVSEIHQAKGHPKNPMSDAEIEAKFRRLVEPVMTTHKADMILNCLWHMEDVRDIRDIWTLFELPSDMW